MEICVHQDKEARAVDQAMAELWQQTADRPAVAELVTLGLHHEQQHQELLLTDLKYNLAINPLYPVYRPNVAQGEAATPAPLEFVEFAGGLYTIGHQAPGFAFDNEGPAHRVYQPDFALAQRLITNGDYLEFIAAGGYQTAAHWLAEGWAMVQNEGWQAPLYWQKRGGDWWVFTLGGLKPVNPAEPVSHVSYFEADAFAQWRGCRLPTEAEWEIAAAQVPVQGNLLAADHLHPQPALGLGPLDQLYGDTWEWTSSPHLAYPGYRPSAGPVATRDSRSMVGHMVLRGGSWSYLPRWLRAANRSWYDPVTRSTYGGFRLARTFPF
jgi:ergothioneine biosynthesis protein EgtB